MADNKNADATSATKATSVVGAQGAKAPDVKIDPPLSGHGAQPQAAAVTSQTPEPRTPIAGAHGEQSATDITTSPEAQPPIEPAREPVTTARQAPLSKPATQKSSADVMAKPVDQNNETASTQPPAVAQRITQAQPPAPSVSPILTPSAAAGTPEKKSESQPTIPAPTAPDHNDVKVPEDIPDRPVHHVGIKLKKETKNPETTTVGGSKTEPNWLYDRYRSATMQRNLMVLLNILALISMLISTTSSTKIIKSKSLDPFVVEVDKKTGIVTLVDQEKIKLFTPDEAMNNFFLVKYIRSRETFDTRNYKILYYKDVRLMSDDKIYRTFLRTLRSDNAQNPMSAYVNNIASSLTVRSLQYLQPSTVQVRFTVEAEMPNGKTVKKNKIAIIGFKYVAAKFSEEDRYVNPLGFTVVSYNSSDEVIQ